MSERLGRIVCVGTGQDYDVYIGRPGKGQDGPFGNPIEVCRICSICEEFHGTKGSTLPCFERYAKERAEEDQEWKKRVIDLQGKTLGCFCGPNQPCHGHVLLQLASEWAEGEGSTTDETIPF